MESVLTVERLERCRMNQDLNDKNLKIKGSPNKSGVLEKVSKINKRGGRGEGERLLDTKE